MTPYARALFIAMLGPMLQAAGVAWDLLEHGVFARGELGHITFQHIVSDPAHLLMATGFAVSCICIPIAIEVALATGKDVPEAEAEAETESDRDVEAAAGFWPGAAAGDIESWR